VEHNTMSDRSRIVTAACVGAIVSGVLGWVYLTDSGRRVRDRVVAIDRFVETLRQARALVEEASRTFSDGGQPLAVLADPSGASDAAQPHT
jgi:hypothetical protein